ncbi:MAG TPA: DNA-binding domain-containing protein [Usitatibacter sp.]|nr:DNA-binding domain-containing protein [Usitatibacter sp.]
MSALALEQARFMADLYSEAECGPGVAIYRRNLFANLGGALAATYPVVERLVGGSFFREAARQYILAHPSQSGDLGDYGAAFARFLERYPPAASLAYLPDVARLEWACHECYGAADTQALDFGTLAQVPHADQARIRFELHPAVRFLRSEHPVAAIWHANQPGEDGMPQRLEGEDHVVVHRGDGAVTVESMAPAPWRLAMSLAGGEALGVAGADAGESLAAHLAWLASSGLIVGFSLGRAAP